jgi:hypothetical protein
MVKQSEQSKRPQQFGMFYPRGYAIVALRSQEDAERMRQLLVDGGYDDEDVKLMDTAKVLEGSSADLEHLSPFIKALGSESQIMESHKAGAGAGQVFLIAYAPSELDTERLMNVARRVGYVKAQKYDRFTFTEL